MSPLFTSGQKANTDPSDSVYNMAAAALHECSAAVSGALLLLLLLLQTYAAVYAAAAASHLLPLRQAIHCQSAFRMTKTSLSVGVPTKISSS